MKPIAMGMFAYFFLKKFQNYFHDLKGLSLLKETLKEIWEDSPNYKLILLRTKHK
ncbi:hypothetical protein NEF87_005010 [Candidatus Lokiarchaeum ossiferum]|uniref:Uncharacterized protein n=1 Tax=Candidatus Lokiarchaeum ossiferum TaxID=2951803 RepID=A0ABY6HZ66_9ARCH|nr:hypothetical protein NEF87_005010 [Candidatus Lokiarchaeum sp. B-35]